jgi:hypothetical protein
MDQGLKRRFIAFLRLADHSPLIDAAKCGRFSVRVSRLAAGTLLIFHPCDVCHRSRVSLFFRPVLFGSKVGSKPQQAFHVVHYQFMLASVLIYME